MLIPSYLLHMHAPWGTTRIDGEPAIFEDLDAEAFETFEDVKEQLEEVERELAKKLGVRRYVRRTLLALDRANQLDEDDDEKVVRWHELYSRYVAWIRADGVGEPPCLWEESPPHHRGEESAQRAAEAALAAL